MKIVTWNVNSLKARRELVELYLDAEAPDVFCIQELKLAADDVPMSLFEERGYHVALHAQPQWNGVLIASKAAPDAVIQGLGEAEEGEARFVCADIAGTRFVNLYCPQGQRTDSPKFPYKLRFFDALASWLEAEADPAQPLVLLGDINIAPRPEDIWDPDRFRGIPSFHPEEHARFERLLDWGLVDVVAPHIPPQTYSFWDYRGGAFHKRQGMRIDHILCTPPIVERVTRAWIDRDWRKKKVGHDGVTKLTASDHTPVAVELAAQ